MFEGVAWIEDGAPHAIAGSRASAGRLALGAPMATPSGDKPIESISAGEDIYGLTSEFEVGLVRVQEVARGDSEPTWKLETADKRSVTATANHPFLALRKIEKWQMLAWLPLAEVKVGDWVACARVEDDLGEVYFSKVVNIESGGVAATFSLVVSGGCHFIADGVVMHNSEVGEEQLSAGGGGDGGWK